MPDNKGLIEAQVRVNPVVDKALILYPDHAEAAIRYYIYNIEPADPRMKRTETWRIVERVYKDVKWALG